jgi:hypothetical protein
MSDDDADLSSIQRTIIVRANELGYFPTADGATRINQMVNAYGFEGMSQAQINNMVDLAIKHYMQSQATDRK